MDGRIWCRHKALQRLCVVCGVGRLCTLLRDDRHQHPGRVRGQSAFQGTNIKTSPERKGSLFVLIDSVTNQLCLSVCISDRHLDCQWTIEMKFSSSVCWQWIVDFISVTFLEGLDPGTRGCQFNLGSSGCRCGCTGVTRSCLGFALQVTNLGPGFRLMYAGVKGYTCI